MIKTTGKNTETVFDHLAISGIAGRLKELNVRTDALTWHRFFGALLLVLLVLLVLTGAFMAFYYSPAPGSAYDSVDYALFTVPFGDVIKGVNRKEVNNLDDYNRIVDDLQTGDPIAMLIKANNQMIR